MRREDRKFRINLNRVIMLLAFGILATMRVSAEEKAIVTFAHPYAGIAGLVRAYEAAVEEFNRNHPNIEVRIVDFPTGDGNQLQQVILASVAGVAPDVLHIWGIGGAISLYDAGVTLDLEPYLSRIPEWQPQEYARAFIDMFRWEGALVGLPSSASAVVLAWNRELFEEVGLDGNQPPEGLMTSAEYARRLSVIGPDGALQRAGFHPFLTWFQEFQIPAWFGQELYNRELGRVELNTERMHRMFDWLQVVYDSQGSLDDVRAIADNGDAAFASKQLAIYQTTRGIINRILQGNPDLVLGQNVMIAPGLTLEGDSQSGLLAAGDANIVLRSAQNPLAAVTFAVDMSLGKAFEVWATHWPLFSASYAVNRNLLQLPGKSPVDLALDHAVSLSLARATIPFPAFPESDFLREQLVPMTEVIRGNLTPVEFLSEAERLVNSQIEERESRD